MKQKVSVITATYNDARHLRQIIRLVAAQDYENIEYIIIDGASTDETPQVLEEAGALFGERLKLLSEPDTGIYAAINKGLALATGDIIGFCFDRYAARDIISRIVRAMGAEQADGAHGDLLYMEGNRIVRYWHQGQGKLRFGWLPGHPTFYVKKEVYERYGNYREDYKVAADYEFMIRCLKDGQVKLAYLPQILVYMEHGGTSSSGPGAYLTSLLEGHRALKENGIRFAWFTDVCRTLRVLLQFGHRLPKRKADEA